MNSAWLTLLRPTLASTFTNGLLAVAALCIGLVKSWHSFLASLYTPEILHNAGSIFGQLFLTITYYLFHSYANYILLIDFWLVVGVFVFIFIRGLEVVFHELAQSFVERNYVWPDRTDHNKPLISILEKWAFWVTDALVLVLYLTIGLRPVFHALNQLLTDDSGSLAAKLGFGLLYLIGAWLAFHIATILLRLLRFKIRLF
jgi:hypothetical protein